MHSSSFRQTMAQWFTSFKLKSLLPSTYYLILKYYLSERHLYVYYGSSLSHLFTKLQVFNKVKFSVPSFIFYLKGSYFWTSSYSHVYWHCHTLIQIPFIKPLNPFKNSYLFLSSDSWHGGLKLVLKNQFTPSPPPSIEMLSNTVLSKTEVSYLGLILDTTST